MQQIAIIGNGDFVPCQALLTQYHTIIALDGGIRHCRRLGVTPTAWLGDGDSSDSTADFIHLSDQLTTDLQKGLQYVAEHYSEPYLIDLFSVTSADRLDHTLNAVQLLCTDSHIRAIYTPTACLQIISQHLSLRLNVGTRLSVLPLDASTVVDITGCQWSGEQLTLDAKHSGLSNMTTAPVVEITVQSGRVIIITELVWIN